MPDIDELFPGKYVKSADLPNPITIRITSVGGDVLEGEKGEKFKGIVKYQTRAHDKHYKPKSDDAIVTGEWVLARTNALLIAAILGTRDYSKWAGHVITIACDPTVMMMGEKVGGIRVVGSPELSGPIKVEVKLKKKKPKTYELQKTDAQGRVRQPQKPSSPPMDPNFGAPPPSDPDAPSAEQEQP